MAEKPDPFMIDDENPEWTDAASAEARPFREVFPAQFEGLKNRGGRPAVEKPKVHIGFRLSPDVVAAIKASGHGYNARVDKVLREAIDKGLL